MCFRINEGIQCKTCARTGPSEALNEVSMKPDTVAWKVLLLSVFSSKITLKFAYNLFFSSQAKSLSREPRKLSKSHILEVEVHSSDFILTDLGFARREVRGIKYWRVLGRRLQSRTLANKSQL
uniref:Uncharacterized protein n=1 Tax=Parascaris univalens TaxID=6257 RepID=A0A914ZNV2_PARUN